MIKKQNNLKAFESK